MKYGRFSLSGQVFHGVVEGDSVVELDGTPFGEHRRTARRHALAGLTVELPCVPGTFYCAGLNYAAHVAWANARTGKNTKLPEKADVGYRANNALVPTSTTMVIPPDAPGPIQYEGELVAVIGRTARNLSEADALSCVLGYTLGNDLSDRGWQKSDRTLWRAKNCDTWKPMGPYIVTGLDPMDQTIRVRVNGEQVSEYHTGKMLFSAQHYIAQITRYMTLHPGDVIWLGTDGATIPDLSDGDVVEICHDEIGVLRNPVAFAPR